MNIVRKYLTCKAFLAVGVITFWVSILADGFTFRDLENLGALIFIGAVVRLAITPATKPHTDMYQAGHEAGYDLGFYDGHRTAKPVVVPFALKDLPKAN